MDQFISQPIFSSLTSILLLTGCYQAGKMFVNNFGLKRVVSSISTIEFQYLSFGMVFLLIVLFPLVAFTQHAKLILQFFGVILIFLSFFWGKDILTSSKKFNKIKNKKNGIFFYLFLIVIFLYFLLSLSPLTSADVVDYHAGTALNILRFDQYKLFPEWFTGLQAGTGEVLIALGFSLGAEQFGSMVQFSSILTISGIIIKFSKKNNLFSSKYFLALTILSCPILIFLLSGNKPQIFFSAIIFLALSLNFVDYKDKRELLKAYAIINILICSAVLGKFSFNLIGFLIWVFSTINFFNKFKSYKLFLIPLSVFILIYLPFIFWKFSNLGGDFLTYFYSPFPLHLPGYENFLNHNKGSQEIPFPNFLFYTTLSRATEFLALNSIFLFILLINFKQNKNIIVLLVLSFLFLIISNIYASPSARYYLDVILWLCLGICFLNKFKFKKIFEYCFYPQIFIVILILIYSSFTFLPGAFSQKSYIKIKHNNAYMFSGMDWVNKNIPDDSRVIIINRPISLYKDFAVSGGFNYFTNFDESKYYKKLISNYNIDYLVYLGNKQDLMHMQGCVKDIFKMKENVGFHATRNPFNKGGKYNAYIFNLDNEKLKNC